jgi:ribosomal protein L19E
MASCPWCVDVSKVEAVVVKTLEEAGKSLERWRIDKLIRRALGRREGAGEDGGTDPTRPLVGATLKQQSVCLRPG